VRGETLTSTIFANRNMVHGPVRGRGGGERNSYCKSKQVQGGRGETLTVFANRNMVHEPSPDAQRQTDIRQQRHPTADSGSWRWGSRIFS
jgi:hypothetical protein